MKEAAVKPDMAVDFLKSICNEVPSYAVVLGSGVSALEDLEDAQTRSFHDVFGVAPTIAGHSGSVTLGRLPEGKNPMIAVFRGRFHLYEGHDWSIVTLAAKSLVEWGVPKLILTNAAGGLNKQFEVGDLMVLTGYRDHLSPKFKEEGLLPAIHAEATKCTNELSDTLLDTGAKLAKSDSSFRPLRKGVYAGLLGPSYETMAEIEMLRRLEADAVGMSTVPELLTAYKTGTTAAAVSVITNVWREDQPMGGHEEVLEASRLASLRLDKLFRAVMS